MRILFIVILSTFVFAGGSLFAQSFFSADIESFIDQMYLQKKSDDQMKELYNQLLPAYLNKLKEAKEVSSQGAVLLELVALEYYMGRAFQSFDTIKRTIEHNEAIRAGKLLSLVEFYTARSDTVKHYDRANGYLNQINKLSLDLFDKNFVAEFFAIKSEIINQLCFLKSVDYSLLNFPQIGKFAKRALKYNPNNLRAMQILWATEIYSIPTYGGNPQKAILSLEKIDLNQVPRTEDKYNILLGRAYCYMRLQQNQKAQECLERCLKYYPTCIFPQAMKEILAAGGFPENY